MKDSKNKNTIILVIIISVALILAYKFLFMSSTNTVSLDSNIASTTEEVANIMQEVESINFDTSVIKNDKFNSLKSLETPLISLPVGKKNPFSSSSN